MRTLTVLCVGMLSICLLNAQKLENTLLWEISGNHLDSPSYLFGTIHMTCDATLKDKVSDALDSTKLLVLEIDMDDPNLTTAMMKHMYMKDNKTIKDLMSDEDYQTLSAFFKQQVGMPLENMQRMKPFFLSAMLYPKFLECSVQSIETQLMHRAQEQGEEIMGLETVEEQMGIFDEIPYHEQVQDLLLSTKDSLKTSQDLFKKVLKAYNNEDINKLAHLTKTDTTQAMYRHLDKMLYDRNKNWIPRIQDFIEQQPTFFGVGAGHLAGEKGIIALLRKEGYTVKPI